MSRRVELARSRGESAQAWRSWGARALLGVVALALLAVIAAPNQLGARRHPSYSAALGALRAISSAQSLFRDGDKEGDGVLDYGTLEELGEQALVDPLLAGGVKAGYAFVVRPTSPFTWWAMARPYHAGNPYFFVNHTGVVHSTSERGFPMCPCQVGPEGEPAPSWVPLAGYDPADSRLR